MRSKVSRASASSGSGLPSIASARCQELFERRFIEGPECQDTRARQKRRIQFETRIFRRRTDQSDRAVLDNRQETILLGAVETVNLVDEQQGPLPDRTSLARLFEDFLEIGNAGMDRRDLHQCELRLAGQEPRHVVLPVPGGPQKIRLPIDRACRRRVKAPSGPEEMILPGDIAERLRPQPIGERMRHISSKAGGGKRSDIVVNLGVNLGFVRCKTMGGHCNVSTW